MIPCKSSSCVLLVHETDFSIIILRGIVAKCEVLCGKRSDNSDFYEPFSKS